MAKQGVIIQVAATTVLLCLSPLLQVCHQPLLLEPPCGGVHLGAEGHAEGTGGEVGLDNTCRGAICVGGGV